MDILFDADMIAFEVTSVCEVETYWGDDIWTLHSDANECRERFDTYVQDIVERALRGIDYEGRYNIIMCLSDDDNFRKKLLPTYKLNRVGKRKPLAYKALIAHIKDNYNVSQIEELEADDVIGLLATQKGHKSKPIIVSCDKDFNSIPDVFLYNHRKDTITKTTKEGADYYHLYQTLVGDQADNYTGCPTIGDKRATSLLEGEPTWSTVVKAFEKQGLTEEDALLQARVARILRDGEYDYKKEEVVLWKP